MEGYGCISNLNVSISLFNSEGAMGKTVKRITRMKPFGKEERYKTCSSAFITKTGKNSGKMSL